MYENIIFYFPYSIFDLFREYLTGEDKDFIVLDLYGYSHR